MTFRQLVLSGLRFHWRSHLGVLLGAILSTAILVGALAVGDSVRYSLRRMALLRLGDTHLALHTQGRFFRTQLADEVSQEVGAPVAPLLILRGTASTNGGETRANRVQVVGIDDRFWKLGATAPLLPSEGEPGVVLNRRLAAKLGVEVGGEVLLRVDKPSLMSRDAPLSSIEDATFSVHLPVAAIAGDEQFGRFGLEANQLPPFNAFVPASLLQENTDLKGRVNALLVGQDSAGKLTQAAANGALGKHWKLADASLQVRELPGAVELRTDRVFVDEATSKAALSAPGARGVLTYFVNELRLGSRAAPYSIVAAMQGGPVPAGLRDNEVVINDWLAENLGAKVGDELTVTYFVVGAMRRLEERKTPFRVARIVPIAGAAADRELMPNFPGVADSENCRDWRPGIPINLKKIRDADETYWDAHRGTPKAFITLAAGQKMWNNRFGNLTAVRYDPPAQSRASVETSLREALNPASIGLFFQPVRNQALQASSQALDFGQLFLGFSFFLIVAALLLTALLFAFGVEQRSEEVGTLLAVGFQPRHVQRMLLLEGASLALVAGGIGAFLGVFYTQAVVQGLSTVWSDAVAQSELRFHAEPLTLAGGAIAGFLVALFSIWLVVRKQARVSARELLAAGAESEARLFGGGVPTRKGLPGVKTALVGILGAVALSIAGILGSHEHAAGIFFGAGGLLLIGGLGACRALLARLERGGLRGPLTLSGLGMRNSVRRRGRSLAVISLLASGSFLVVSIGASRHDPHEGALKRSSGTGGFALYAETTLPVHHDLNSTEGQDVYGLDPKELGNARILPLRLREGDEASCLNLNRAQTPRVLGVQPAVFAQAHAFTFTSLIDKDAARDPWSVLTRPDPSGAVPAVGDMNTVVWGLGKGVGATLPMTDESGRPFEIRIVGILANSVLQGSLLIAEDRFIERFPSQSGYQVFLIDPPAAGSNVEVKAVAEELSRSLEDAGMDVTPTPERLAAFNSVENTYLSIFAILGGLGMILGSIGLGVVVLRHVLERRGELGLLRAVGFRSQALQWLVFSEHSLLLVLGLLVGIVAAVVAVLPSLLSPGAEVPYASLAVTLAAVFLSGFLWTWAATALALRSPVMAALRNE